MAKTRRLRSKQLALIEDLYTGVRDEQQVLKKSKVGGQLLRKWLEDEQFVEELNQRVAGAYWQSTLLIARGAVLAVKRLVELTACGKEEAARKTRMDIVAMNPSTGLTGGRAACDDNTEESAPIPPETASRLLAVLAEGDGTR